MLRVLFGGQGRSRRVLSPRGLSGPGGKVVEAAGIEPASQNAST